MIWYEKPQRAQYNDNDLEEYGNLVRQTNIISFPNEAGAGASDPHDTWKFKNILQYMHEDAGETGRMEFDAATVGDVGESSDIASPASTRKPSSYILPPLPPPSPLHTRANG